MKACVLSLKWFIKTGLRFAFKRNFEAFESSLNQREKNQHSLFSSRDTCSEAQFDQSGKKLTEKYFF